MGISIWQILIIVLIILILFGTGRLSQVMADLAKGIRTFRAGLKDDDEAGSTAVDRAPGAPLAKPETTPAANPTFDKDHAAKS